MRSRFLHRLACDNRGAMLIETAIVAPVLVLLSLGAFQTSQIIARQTELQDAASEAAAIVLAAAPDTEAKRTIVKNIIVASTGLSASQVTISERFRCGSDTSFVTTTTSCTGKVSHYILIQLDDTYTPIWTEWGVGNSMSYNIDRYVMVKQT